MKRTVPDRIHATTTRRNLLRAAAGTGLFLFADSLVFAASDFWTKKPPADWSSDEIRQLRTKSPWAKKVRGEIASPGGPPASGLDASAGGAGMPRGSGSPNAAVLGDGGVVGGEPGGRGGRGGAAPLGGTGGPQAPEVIIRWESALPLLAATKSRLPPELENRYTIGVTGLPPQMILLGLTPPGGRGHMPLPQDPAARQKAEINAILSETSLTAKGHDPVIADVMLRTTDAQTFLFGFPKQDLPVTLSDKEVLFAMKLGILTIKAKFDPREMTFDGQLAV